jgi:dipeptidyl aminopeptidase/acylaminoacyl peptidase
VEWISVAPDRRTLAYAVNEDGFSRVYALEAGRREPRALPNVPAGVNGEARFRPGAKAREFAITVANAASPGDVYVCDLATDRCVRWTFSETGGLPADAFRFPQLVRYPAGHGPGPGGGQVPAWLYRPDSAAFPGPRPVLIQIHGGPEQQARPGFDPFLQFLAGRMGIAVIQPNVRGSSGYGKTWLKADDGYARMGSVRVIGALLDWIKTAPGLDASRAAVAGRSYGGFMSLSTLVEYGPRLKAGISAVGISHFPTFLKKTSGYRRDLRRAEYGDERDPRMAAFLDSISPLTRADRIRTPLLLCHGRNDPRVPYGESERIFAALKARKVTAWFLTFADEGHGVRDQDNQLALWRVQAEFLAQQLGTSAAGP